MLVKDYIHSEDQYVFLAPAQFFSYTQDMVMDLPF